MFPRWNDIAHSRTPENESPYPAEAGTTDEQKSQIERRSQNVPPAALCSKHTAEQHEYCAGDANGLSIAVP